MGKITVKNKEIIRQLSYYYCSTRMSKREIGKEINKAINEVKEFKKWHFVFESEAQRIYTLINRVIEGCVFDGWTLLIHPSNGLYIKDWLDKLGCKLVRKDISWEQGYRHCFDIKGETDVDEEQWISIKEKIKNKRNGKNRSKFTRP